MKKGIKTIACALFIILLITGCTMNIDSGEKEKVYNVNETANISYEKIKITVLESENYHVEGATNEYQNGNYTKVKISIENYGTEDYNWTIFNFAYGDAPVLLYDWDDALKNTIAAGETATGYIYFDRREDSLLVYYYDIDKKDHDIADRCIFEVK